MDLYLWRSEAKDGFCVIETPSIKAVWELNSGKSRLETFPNDVTCQMSSRYPKDIGLTDNIHGATISVISARLKALLEREVVVNRLEFLPVQILDHKGRVASAEYFILHPLDVCDCIDTEKSGVQWNRITSGLISRCAGLVFRENAVPSGFNLFRPKYWGSNILVGHDLAEALKDSGLTGLVFRPAMGYQGIG